jgi:cell division protease FtsH
MDHLVDLHLLSSQTPGFSGADIANICNEAALIAARGKKNQVQLSDFTEAIDRVVAGLERKSKIIRPEEKRIIAYHESGHALVSWMLKQVDPLVKLSIIPRGKSLGAAWYLPEEKQLKSKTAFVEQLIAMLAGRAAEELVIGDVSSGSLDDLEKATREAYAMIAIYGFNDKIGPVSFYDSTGRQENSLQKPFSEETGKIIDEEVRKLIGFCYQRATDLLKEHRSKLEDLANLIVKKEVVYKDELELLLGTRDSGVVVAK